MRHCASSDRICSLMNKGANRKILAWQFPSAGQESVALRALVFETRRGRRLPLYVPHAAPGVNQKQCAQRLTPSPAVAATSQAGASKKKPASVLATPGTKTVFLMG